jgi:starch phosphorylase
MVRDYTEGYYEPAARHTDALQADDAKRARALAAWKRRVGDAWDAVAVRVEPLGSGTAEVGDVFTVHATVTLGTLSPEDMEVQILHGPVDDYDEIEDPKLALMAPSTEATGTVPYAGSFTCEVGGRYGVAVRVVPTHPDLAAPTELGLVAWAPEAGS